MRRIVAKIGARLLSLTHTPGNVSGALPAAVMITASIPGPTRSLPAAVPASRAVCRPQPQQPVPPGSCRWFPTVDPPISEVDARRVRPAGRRADPARSSVFEHERQLPPSVALVGDIDDDWPAHLQPLDIERWSAAAPVVSAGLSVSPAATSTLASGWCSGRCRPASHATASAASSSGGSPSWSVVGADGVAGRRNGGCGHRRHGNHNRHRRATL